MSLSSIFFLTDEEQFDINHLFRFNNDFFNTFLLFTLSLTQILSFDAPIERDHSHQKLSQKVGGRKKFTFEFWP